MKASQRVFVNTIAQYGRTVINMVLSLYTVRLVLLTLGASDYGIYTLVAGVVSMLAFITNSLVSTTQRYVSFYQGKGNLGKLKEVFNNSLIIHLIIGLFVVIALEALIPLLFQGFLNIPSERTSAAQMVYQTVVWLIFFSFTAAPYRALLISHENIVYISIIDVLDGILKVILVILLTQISYDKLVWYGLIMLGVQVFNFLAFSVYCYNKYEECVLPNFKRINTEYLKGMFSFAGWSLYSTGCIIGRQQGIAIVLNKVAGPVINAAYGIGFQVAGYTNFLSASLVNAISPQIMKAEGAGDRDRALWLSNVTSKFIFFLLSAVCVPCMFEINEILEWWLKDVPENANIFCIMVMAALLCDSLSIGLMYVNQAIGKIGLYTVVLTTPKLITLPIVWILLKSGVSLTIVAGVYVVIELLCAIMRVPFIKRTAGLKVGRFFKEVTLHEVLPFMVCLVTSYFCSRLFSFDYGFVLTFIVTFICYGASIYLLGLTKTERNIILGVLNGITNKFGNHDKD